MPGPATCTPTPAMTKMPAPMIWATPIMIRSKRLRLRDSSTRPAPVSAGGSKDFRRTSCCQGILDHPAFYVRVMSQVPRSMRTAPKIRGKVMGISRKPKS